MHKKDKRIRVKLKMLCWFMQRHLPSIETSRNIFILYYLETNLCPFNKLKQNERTEEGGSKMEWSNESDECLGCENWINNNVDLRRQSWLASLLDKWNGTRHMAHKSAKWHLGNHTNINFSNGWLLFFLSLFFHLLFLPFTYFVFIFFHCDFK